jgi:hypothetical protein
MPVANLLITGEGSADLHDFNDDVVVRVTLPAMKTGAWMLTARVVIVNADDGLQNASARLTTDDGATVLDLVDDIRCGGYDTPRDKPISLQADLRSHGSEQIVDLRCSTYNGTARYGRLFALRVDDVQSQ